MKQVFPILNFQETINFSPTKPLNENWNFQEIKAMLIQKEGRLKKMKDNSIHLTTYDGTITIKSKSGEKGKGNAQLKVKEGGV